MKRCKEDNVAKDYVHFSVEKADDNVVWVGLDTVGKSVNVLSRDVMDELTSLTTELTTAPPAGLVFFSKKERGFIFGADINEFAQYDTTEALTGHIGQVLASFQRIEDLPCPTVILVDGMCLGGGYELALSFDRIIGVDGSGSQFGLPEVNLGLLPGYGGSARAFDRMGLAGALSMILSGRPMRAPEALAAGAIDHVVATKADLREAAQAVMAGKIDRKPAALCDDPQALITTERAKLAQRSRPENTPAPFAILDHLGSNNANKNSLLRDETNLFCELMFSSASVGLRRVFQLNDLVKKGGRVESNIRHIHVVGAGVMGGDIAAVAAMSGFHVTLQDMNEAAINAAIDRARALYERRLKVADKVDATLARLVADPSGAGLVEADLMIEAVAENLDIKQSVFAAAEKIMKPDAIMATNTSAIPLEDIGDALTSPERLIGMHFFNPVPVLPLVEIVYTAASRPAIVARAMGVAGTLKKLPIRCKSAPGFLVNRALLPYVFEAIDAVIAGENPDMIDQALVRFGMPMGPIELADQVGLDVCHDAGIVLGISDAARSRLQSMIAAGTIGRKSGSGFYSWSDKKADRPRGIYDEDLLDHWAHKLLAPLVKECRDAVAEKVVDNADMADAACIFGVGFPAHTGGPLFWHDNRDDRNGVTAEPQR